MKTKVYSFNYSKNGRTKRIVLSAPFNGRMVQTSRFTPVELLQPVNPLFIGGAQYEDEQEFISDCQKLIHLSTISQYDDLFHSNLEALFAILMNHVEKFKRLLFNDLLTYIDCFSYILFAHGFSEAQVKQLYPGVVKMAVDQLPYFLKCQYTLMPFTSSFLYNNIVSHYKSL